MWTNTDSKRQEIFIKTKQREINYRPSSLLPSTHDQISLVQEAFRCQSHSVSISSSQLREPLKTPVTEILEHQFIKA